MSFKYRFILSFVFLEIVFITLIVTMNFVAINNSSKTLIADKIESNESFLVELIKIPISIYDIATIDDLLVKTQESKYINSMVVLDNQNRVLSSNYMFKYIEEKDLLPTKKNFTYELEDEVFEIRYKEIFEGDTYLGALYLIFDTSNNKQFITNNTNNTLMIIIVEIILSTILSYLIGSKLTVMLTNLADTAKEIGENKHPDIPYLDKKNEIGILSNSMNQMQIDLKTRNNKLKELAVQLNTQKNELIDAHKAKDDFLANMSHELKTPLNSINVISSVMMKNKKGTLDEAQVKNLSIINNCGKDLLYLINDILDISKLEAGEIELNNFTIDVKKLITEIKDMFLPQANQKGINFTCEIDNNVTKMFSDENRIKQVVKNLLSNALKFTQEGEIKLLVKANGDVLEILVKDQGIGIEQEKLEHIFDRFKQADSSTTRKFGGTGLGLAISKELAKLMGGDIEVKSKAGHGSIFKVTIAQNKEEVVQENVVEEELIKENQVIAKKSVLVLNNDPVNFLNIVVELNKISEVIQVGNLKDLFTKLENEIFDFVMIDTTKIDINNLLNFDFTNSNLILFSDENEQNDNLKQKTQFVLNKPINKSELISIVKA